MTQLAKYEADRINELHAGIEATLNKTIADAIEVGRLLMEAKANVKHGEFTTWINNNLTFTDRTAQRYMKLYDNRHRLEGAGSISDAYKLLAPPKTDTVSDIDKIADYITGVFLIDSLIPKHNEVVCLHGFAPKDKETNYEVLNIEHSKKHGGHLNPTVMRVSTNTDYGYEVYNKRGGVKIQDTRQLIRFWMHEYNFLKTAMIEIKDANTSEVKYSKVATTTSI